MNKNLAQSNSDSDSLPCKERDGTWITGNENIFKVLKKPADHNSFNNGDKKQIFRLVKQAIFSTPFSLLPSSLTFSSSLNNVSESKTSTSSNLTDSEKKGNTRNLRNLRLFLFCDYKSEKSEPIHSVFPVQIECPKQLNIFKII